MTDTPLDDKPFFFRMDWELIPAINRETGQRAVLSVPDRRRYEYVEAEVGKEAGYLDKVDRVFFPLSVIESMIQQLPATPMYDQPHELGDVSAYVDSRKQLLRHFFESGACIRGHDPARTTTHQVDVNAAQAPTLMTAVVYADLVGSTKLSRELPATSYAKLVSVFREELLAALPAFHGLPLKTFGDAVIAYFAAPSMNIKADHSLDCALTMRMVNYYVLNPLFEEFSLPRVDVAIALDAGEVSLIPDVSGQDITAHWLNRLKRIQELAEPGRVLVGESLFRILHQGWRERCVGIELPSDWPENGDSGQPYKVFEVVG